MKKYFSYLILSLILLLSGCSGEKNIEVGFVGSLSGRTSELGVMGRRGIELAFNKINSIEDSKYRFELVSEDNKNDRAVNVAAISSLIDREVPFILGPYLSSMAAGTLQVIKNKDVLVISPTVATDIATAIDDNFLRLTMDVKYQSYMLADAMIEDGKRDAVIIYDTMNAAYSLTSSKFVKERFEELGGRVLTIHAFTDKSDEIFKEIANTMSSYDFDCVVFATAGFDAAYIAQQFRKIGIDQSLYGLKWVQTYDLIEHGGKAVEGMKIITNIMPESGGEEFTEFYNAFLETYNTQPTFNTLISYEAALLLYEGIRLADSDKPEDVKKAILDRSEFKLVKDTIRFDKYGDLKRPLSIVEIKNGAFTLNKTIEPE